MEFLSWVDFTGLLSLFYKYLFARHTIGKSLFTICYLLDCLKEASLRRLRSTALLILLCILPLWFTACGNKDNSRVRGCSCCVMVNDGTKMHLAAVCRTGCRLPYDKLEHINGNTRVRLVTESTDWWTLIANGATVDKENNTGHTCFTSAERERE